MLKLKVGPYKSCDPQNNIGRGEGRGGEKRGRGGGGRDEQLCNGI